MKRLKKVLCIFLVFVFAFSFNACVNQKEASPDETFPINQKAPEFPSGAFD